MAKTYGFWDYLKRAESTHKVRPEDKSKREYKQSISFAAKPDSQALSSQYNKARKKMGLSEETQITQKKYDQMFGNSKTGDTGTYSRWKSYNENRKTETRIKQGKPDPKSWQGKVDKYVGMPFKWAAKTAGKAEKYLKKDAREGSMAAKTLLNVGHAAKEGIDKLDRYVSAPSRNYAARQIDNTKKNFAGVSKAKGFEAKGDQVIKGVAKTINQIRKTVNPLNDLKGKKEAIEEAWKKNKRVSGEEINKKIGIRSKSQVVNKVLGGVTEGVLDPTSWTGAGLAARGVKSVLKKGAKSAAATNAAANTVEEMLKETEGKAAKGAAKTTTKAAPAAKGKTFEEDWYDRKAAAKRQTGMEGDWNRKRAAAEKDLYSQFQLKGAAKDNVPAKPTERLAIESRQQKIEDIMQAMEQEGHKITKRTGKMDEAAAEKALKEIEQERYKQHLEGYKEEAPPSQNIKLPSYEEMMNKNIKDKYGNYERRPDTPYSDKLHEFMHKADPLEKIDPADYKRAAAEAQAKGLTEKEFIQNLQDTFVKKDKAKADTSALDDYYKELEDMPDYTLRRPHDRYKAGMKEVTRQELKRAEEEAGRHAVKGQREEIEMIRDMVKDEHIRTDEGAQRLKAQIDRHNDRLYEAETKFEGHQKMIENTKHVTDNLGKSGRVNLGDMYDDFAELVPARFRAKKGGKAGTHWETAMAEAGYDDPYEYFQTLTNIAHSKDMLKGGKKSFTGGDKWRIDDKELEQHFNETPQGKQFAADLKRLDKKGFDTIKGTPYDELPVTDKIKAREGFEGEDPRFEKEVKKEQEFKEGYGFEDFKEGEAVEVPIENYNTGEIRYVKGKVRSMKRTPQSTGRNYDVINVDPDELPNGFNRPSSFTNKQIELLKRVPNEAREELPAPPRQEMKAPTEQELKDFGIDDLMKEADERAGIALDDKELVESKRKFEKRDEVKAAREQQQRKVDEYERKSEEWAHHKGQAEAYKRIKDNKAPSYNPATETLEGYRRRMSEWNKAVVQAKKSYELVQKGKKDFVGNRPKSANEVVNEMFAAEQRAADVPAGRDPGDLGLTEFERMREQQNLNVEQMQQQYSRFADPEAPGLEDLINRAAGENQARPGTMYDEEAFPKMKWEHFDKAGDMYDRPADVPMKHQAEANEKINRILREMGIGTKAEELKPSIAEQLQLPAQTREGATNAAVENSIAAIQKRLDNVRAGRNADIKAARRAEIKAQYGNEVSPAAAAKQEVMPAEPARAASGAPIIPNFMKLSASEKYKIIEKYANENNVGFNRATKEVYEASEQAANKPLKGEAARKKVEALNIEATPKAKDGKPQVYQDQAETERLVQEAIDNGQLDPREAPLARVDTVNTPAKGAQVVDDVQKQLDEDYKGLRNVKDINQLQVGTKTLHEVISRLPTKIRGHLRNTLDFAKRSLTNFEEKETNELYNTVVRSEKKGGLGIKKGSKESKMVQRFGEKTLAKEFIEKAGKDIGDYSPEQINALNEKLLRQQMPEAADRIIAADKYFRSKYDDYIDQINAVRMEIYNGNPDKLVPKLDDYYHHFNTMQGLEGYKNMLFGQTNIDPRLEGISEFTKPKTKFQSFMQKRVMGTYTDDAVEGFLKYIQGAGHSIHVDPVVSTLNNAADILGDQAVKQGANINKIIEALRDHAQDLAGKTNPYDRWLQKIIGRKGMNILTVATNRVKQNLILGNLGSVMAQTGNIPLSVGKAGAIRSTQAIGSTMADMAKLAGAKLTKQHADIPIMKSDFIKERFKGEYYSRFDEKLLQKPKKAAEWLMNTMDKGATHYIWNSMYARAKAKGITGKALMEYADRETKKIVAGRGVGEVPLLQKSKTAQVFLPFQLEVANQWKVLGDMVGKKRAGALMTYVIASYGYNKAMEEIRGSGVSYDPIGAAQEGYEKGEDWKDGVLRAAGSVAGETIGNIPGGNYLTGALGDKKIYGTDTKLSDVFQGRDPNRFGSGLTAAKIFEDPLYYGVMPFGGNQLRKTTIGEKTLKEGGYFNKKGEMAFPTTGKAWDNLQTLAFGAHSTDIARKYYDTETRPLGSKQTERVKMAGSKAEQLAQYTRELEERHKRAKAKKDKETAKK